MPSKNAAFRFQNIIEEIDFVMEATAEMDFEEFTQNQTIRRAVERSYSIISEAAAKLGDDAETLAPGVPWPDIRGLGNVIRHEYGDIDYESLWEIRDNDLAPLRSSCEKALEQLHRSDSPTNGNKNPKPTP